MNKFATIATLICVATFQPVLAAETGLVGQWTFDDGAGAIAADASGNGNNGTLFAGGRAHPEWGEGAFAGSVGLSGGWGAYVQVPASASLNSVSEAITVTALVYPRAIWVKGDKHNAFIALAQRQWRQVQHPDQFYLGYGSQGDMLTYKWHVGLEGDDKNELSLYRLPPDGSPPAIDRWVFVAGTYDGASGAMRLYVDGVLIGEDNRPGRIRLDAESLERPLALGAELNKPELQMTSGSFNGYLGEVRLYNRALSPEEVMALSRAALAAP